MAPAAGQGRAGRLRERSDRARQCRHRRRIRTDRPAHRQVGRKPRFGPIELVSLPVAWIWLAPKAGGSHGRAPSAASRFENRTALARSAVSSDFPRTTGLGFIRLEYSECAMKL